MDRWALYLARQAQQNTTISTLAIIGVLVALVIIGRRHFDINPRYSDGIFPAVMGIFYAITFLACFVQ